MHLLKEIHNGIPNNNFYPVKYTILKHFNHQFVFSVVINDGFKILNDKMSV